MRKHGKVLFFKEEMVALELKQEDQGREDGKQTIEEIVERLS